MIQINANVSGFDPTADAVPSLMNDSGRLAAWLFDPNSLIRGHWELPDYSPANGWTMRWSDQLLRVWLSLDETHQPLLPGSYELALLHGDAHQPMPGVLAYRPPALPIVTVSGLDLVANGSRWVYNGCSHFLALERLLLGQDVIAYSGFNVARVFGLCVNISGQAGFPPLSPDTFGNYFDGLSRLADVLAGQGRYLDFCALADVQLLGWSVSRQQSFIAQCADVLRPKPNVLFDLGNEPWNNGFDPRHFSRPSLPMACSRGSIQDAGGEDGFDGPGAAWDLIRVHTRRDFPKMLTHCALPDPLYTYGKPIVVDEPFKLCDPTHGGYFDPAYARIGGQLGRAINGICFHTPGGVFSQALTPQEDACRHAWIA